MQFANGPISITTDTPSVVSLPLESVSFPTNAEVTDDGSGGLYATGLALTGFGPALTAETKSLAAALDLIDLGGTCVLTGGTLTKVEQYYRGLNNCQTGTLLNRKDTVTTGLLTLQSLSASRGQDATLSFLLSCLSDGTNAPVATTSTSVTLPTTITKARFTLGLVTVAGVDLPEVDSANLDFQVEKVESRLGLGQIWPTSDGVLTVRPKLTIVQRDLSKLTNALLAAGAEAATHANTVVRLKKRGSPSAFVDDATSEHITITMAGLSVRDSLASVSGTAAGNESITLYCYDDTVNAPVVIDTTAAYSES